MRLNDSDAHTMQRVAPISRLMAWAYCGPTRTCRLYMTELSEEAKNKERSAKPLFVSSILTRASKKTNDIPLN